MDAVAALLIVVFHFFFGWCGEDPGRSPPAAPSEASSIR
jgi:peptidoglycan/LPS O-acetylase OafA/YrhL